MSAWIDVSVPVRSGMVHWPGEPEVRVERRMDLTQGDAATVSTLSMSAHTGTHMDAPSHFIEDGASIDALPVDAVVGPARVVVIEHASRITAPELERHDLREGERVLFRTANSNREWWDVAFREDYVYVAKDAAEHLVERGVRTIGVDYLSVGGFKRDGIATHRVLLAASIWIVEGLDLTGVEPGHYDLLCLPLRIAGADGAPARAFVRTR